MSASRHSESTPDRRRIPLCVHDYTDCREFRTVQEALQTATAAVSSHNFVSLTVVETGGYLWWTRVETRGHVVNSALCTLCPFHV